MSECEKHLEIMSAMLDGEVSEAERCQLMLHIENCPACRAAYDAFMAVSNELSELAEVPESLCKNVMAQVRTSKKRTKFSPMRYGAIAACFVLVAYLGMSDVLGNNAANDTEIVYMTAAESADEEAESAAPMMMDAPRAVAEMAVSEIEINYGETSHIISDIAQIENILALVEFAETSDCNEYNVIASLSFSDGQIVEVAEYDGDVICIRDDLKYHPVGAYDEIISAIEQ